MLIFSLKKNGRKESRAVKRRLSIEKSSRIGLVALFLFTKKIRKKMMIFTNILLIGKMDFLTPNFISHRQKCLLKILQARESLSLTHGVN